MEIWSSNLPGHRGDSKKLLQDIESVIDFYYVELKKILRSQYIFFGYSMGGIIAYFLAARIFSKSEFNLKPAALILSACGSPSSFQNKNYSSWSNNDLLERLRSYGGLSDEILCESSLLDYLMPIFRADFRILETSADAELIQLDIPVYFLWGENDQIVSIDAVLQWSKYFLSEINLIPIKNGSHMFVQDQAKIVSSTLEEIVESLERLPAIVS